MRGVRPREDGLRRVVSDLLRDLTSGKQRGLETGDDKAMCCFRGVYFVVSQV